MREDTNLDNDTYISEMPIPTNFVTTEGWSLDGLLSQGRNFQLVPVVDIAQKSPSQIEDLVKSHEKSGLPLLMRNWNETHTWGKEIFDPTWLEKEEGDSTVQVRNLYNREDREMTLPEYLRYAIDAPHYAALGETERFYAKDGACPEKWHDWVNSNVPGHLIPFGKGDLSSLLENEDRVETLMTYMGIGDTYTPAHKDSCASVGHNLMVYTSDESTSSFWFLTSTADSHKASDYWHKIGQELDLESHLATIEELAKADFPVYICQQGAGDFIIVPPKSCHQVINTGGLTVKVSWSRMTVRSLELALTQELPIYRRVCRPEVYRVRALIHAAVVQTTAKFKELSKGVDSKSQQSDLLMTLKKLLPLYLQMVEESSVSSQVQIASHPLDSEVCGFCGSDIWQSALMCENCTLDDNGRNVLICPPCYLDGRSCLCKRMRPVQSSSQEQLLEVANNTLRLLRQHTNTTQEFPLEFTDKNLQEMELNAFFRKAIFLSSFRSILGEYILKTRKCNMWRKSKGETQESHTVFIDEGINCNECHNGQCWEHILERYGKHICSVIPLFPQYKALQDSQPIKFPRLRLRTDAWHSFHFASRNYQWTDAYPDFSMHWESWLPQLTWKLRPISPLNTKVSPGWYDGLMSPQPQPTPNTRSMAVKRKSSVMSFRNGSAAKKQRYSTQDDTSSLSSLSSEDWVDPKATSASNRRSSVVQPTRKLLPMILPRVPASQRPSYKSLINGQVPPHPDAVADQVSNQEKDETTLTELKSQVQALTGMVEALTRKVDTLEHDLKNSHHELKESSMEARQESAIRHEQVMCQIQTLVDPRWRRGNLNQMEEEP
ncbi:hypothetical protein CPB86DRAFT_780884 [Serendipita vermifera]|nr:hypothetical protein CPB86DRAFT_780884 [Serendipita vermifera]